MLQIRKNFNQELGQVVYTIERKDGAMLLPASGIQGLNYSTIEGALGQLPLVKKHVANGGDH